MHGSLFILNLSYTNTDRVVVELSPVKVFNTYADGHLEEFRCSYESRLRLRIEFLTVPNWRRLTSSLRGPAPAGLSFPEPTWTRSLTVRIPISPQLRRVTCRIKNEEDEVVAEVFASVRTTGQD